jgi:predicted amidohydrolase
VSRIVRVAAAQYPIEWLADRDAWRAKLERWVADAAGAGAQLLLFPEYTAMETASLFPEPVPRDLTLQLAAVAELVDEADALHRALARQHGVWIVAGSSPVRHGDGFRNRARLLGPSGAAGVQDKVMMTRFEREQWHVGGGDRLAVFDTPLGRLAIAICYDVEFPLLARRAAQAGAELLLVPSCTDTARGYYRVRTGAQARALEHQIAVVHAPTVGLAPWSPAVDVNVGAAAVYVPPDLDFPDDGVLAIGERDQPGWVHAEIDLDRLARCRRDGDVLNARDWPEQVLGEHAVETIVLR